MFYIHITGIFFFIFSIFVKTRHGFIPQSKDPQSPQVLSPNAQFEPSPHYGYPSHFTHGSHFGHVPHLPHLSHSPHSQHSPNASALLQCPPQPTGGCKELYNSHPRKNITLLDLKTNVLPFFVKCNHDEYGGGWTYVLNRFDGNTSFSRNWQDCVNGFGNINQEFFIGLNKLHALTQSTLHELLFILEDFDNVTKLARYNAFAIEDEERGFAINVLGDYSGSAGDSFTYHSGYKFSTKDKDLGGLECPAKRASPGWFNFCTESNIFGHYLKGEFDNSKDVRFRGMVWYSFRGSTYSLKRLAMLIRPVSN